jgi:hypothetical protein
MPFNLQGFNSPQEFHLPAADMDLPGKIGTIYETSTYGGQLCKLVDAVTVAAGDIVYHKSHAGSFEVTMTIGNSSPYEVAGAVGGVFAVNDLIFVQKKGTCDVKANGTFADGYHVWPDTGNNRVVPAGRIAGSLSAAADTGGAIFAVANPCTGAWLVGPVFVTTTTKSTGVCTVDIGVAANGTTLNDGLIDGLDVGTGVVTNANNYANAGTNGKAAQQGAAGTYLTASTASGNIAGAVGTYSATFQQLGYPNLPIIGIALGAVSGGKVSMKLDIPYHAYPRN